MNKTKFIFLLCFLLLNSVLSLKAQNDRAVKTIVIDAGHGGKDTGTIGKKGNEKDLVLDVALRVGAYIEQNMPQVKVIYTRKTDVFLELHERAKIANDNHADLFLSIHANSAGNHSAKGTESFVMGLDKSSKNLAIVKKENSVILQEDNYQQQYGDFNPQSPEAYIIFSLYQNIHLKQSLRFAQLIQNQFKTRVHRRDRGVKQAPFWVLWDSESPSVLVELGFISNQEEGNFLFSEQGKDYMASAIYRAFKEYKIEIDGPLEEQKTDKENNTTKSEKSSKKGKDNKAQIKKKTTKKGAKKQANKKNIEFRVQFYSSPTPIRYKGRSFKGLKPVQQYKSPRYYRYTYGVEYDLESIIEVQTKVRKKYPDAFVIAFKNGKKISVKQALKELKKKP